MTQSVTSDKKITIGITCYNAAGTIERALKSALAQDWPDFDIAVVDDCSDDASWPTILDIAARHSRITPVRHDVNKGTAAARNTLQQMATGDFIAFFDDDDESLPQRLRRQYEALAGYEKHTGHKLIACYASGVRRYPNGYELAMPAIGSRPIVPTGPAVADYLLFNGRHPGLFYGSGTPACALMTRVSTIRSVSGFDPALRRVEDVDLAVRIALQNGHFVGVPEILFVQHATQSSDKTASKNLESELTLIDKHADYLKKKGCYDYARRWFIIRSLHFDGRHRQFFVALAALFVRYPLQTIRHLWRSLPARWIHEMKMKRSTVRTE